MLSKVRPKIYKSQALVAKKFQKYFLFVYIAKIDNLLQKYTFYSLFQRSYFGQVRIQFKRKLSGSMLKWF